MSDDLSMLDDPSFLDERARVRETIAALTERYRKLNEEFDRRCQAAWTAGTMPVPHPSGGNR